MSADGQGLVSFVLLAERLADLHGLLASAFTHPWVASYQIGFGPPLVRSSDRLGARLATARSALEKLAAYLEVCVLDEDERRRLADAHRRLTVRRLGPVDAEAIDDASAAALDLSLRLHHPALAPGRVAAELDGAGLSAALGSADLAPDALSGRFLVRLGDPRGARLLHHRQVEVLGLTPESALAVELRVPVGVRALYGAWLAARARAGALRHFVELEELTPHAKTSSDGARR